MSKAKELVYSVLNILNKGKGFTVKFVDFEARLPTRYFRYFPRDYEADNFRFLKASTKPGDVIIDIGAHFGLFAVRAAQLIGPSGKVYAFEPTNSTFRILKETIAINQQEQTITPVKAAVADKDGQTVFYSSDSAGDVANSLVNYNDQLHKGTPVEMIACDSFVKKNRLQVNFLKIDAEGAELSVLKGAEATLRDQKPNCILAMHPGSIVKFGDSNEAIWNFLQPFGYKILYHGSIIDKKTFCEKTELFDVHLVA